VGSPITRPEPNCHDRRRSRARALRSQPFIMIRTKSAEAPSKDRIKQSTNVSRALGRPNQEMRANIVISSLLNRGAYIQLDDPLRASQAWTALPRQITHGPIVHACTCFGFPCSFDLTMEPPPFTGRRIVDRVLCVWYYAHSTILRTCLARAQSETSWNS
jgi:hypothetical protein